MSRHAANAQVVSIRPTDVNKTLQTLAEVWTALGGAGASRKSLLVNLGGGMVTDLGGFAAATFKRGIRFINIPTTLLSMVDAAVGGKTGINFGGLKNEIGSFCESAAVIVDTQFLNVRPRKLAVGLCRNAETCLAEQPRNVDRSFALRRDSTRLATAATAGAAEHRNEAATLSRPTRTKGAAQGTEPGTYRGPCL